MPTVRGAAGAAAKAVSVVLLCAVVVGCAAWGMDRWGEAARLQVTAEEHDLTTLRPGPVAEPLFPLGPQDVAEVLPGSDSAGDIAVSVRRTGSADVRRVTFSYRLSLRSDDPLIGKLRADPGLISEVVYVLPGGYVTAQTAGDVGDAVELEAADTARFPAWCTVSQPTRGSRVTVTAEHSVTTQDTSLNFLLGLRAPDGDEGVVPRLPGRWTWSMDVPRGWGLRARGRPEGQTARSVRFHLTEKRGIDDVTAALLMEDPAEEAAPVNEPAATASRHLAMVSLLALFLTTAGACAALLRRPTGTSGAAYRPRAVALGVGGLVAAATGALLWDLYQPNWSVLGWMSGSTVFASTELASQVLPIEVRTQGVLLGILLFALPVVATAVGHRLRTSGPPPVLPTLAVAAPAPALVLLFCIMGGPDWLGPVGHCLVSASVASLATLGLLRLQPWWPGLRAWAVPVAAAAWAGVASAVVLQAVPRDLWQAVAGDDLTLTRAALVASWPAVFLLLTPWIAALLVLSEPLSALVPASRRRRTALGLLLITALLPWWTPLHEFPYAESPPTAGLFIQLTGQSPGEQLIIGISTMAPALQLIWLAAVALLLLHLNNTGTAPRRWHHSARASCVLLLVLAACSTVIGAPESWLPYWTTAAALATAWGGGALLLPRGHAEAAARRHAYTGAAHTRLVSALARALLFAEGRHRFLTSSRATLADTSLPANTWDDTWQSLKQPTASDANRETTRLRADALGGSAGRTAWVNGVAATAATALLTAPWTIWTALQAHGYSGVLEVVTVAGGPTCVWLAHGFTYGYLYAWLRGNSPVVKAGWLWGVMSAVQLLLLVPKLQVPGESTALSVFLLLSQTAVMALGLGLYWEIRLVRRADLLWGHIRNFRRLSSLATPLSAVLVAAIAAAVTVLATAWANDVTAPVETPSPSSSPSSSTSPGAPP
ncbi:hypothetical protein AB0N81_21840 [Streptomyces sp. NPDC093510]|uniref:hypothetical protein n=1 Tax=Streptomyces sp. NPDC093510 TaxID=3155199 RepID=UPI00341FA4B1